MNILNLIGRNAPLFHEDINLLEGHLVSAGVSRTISCYRWSWTIGQAVTKEIFKRDPKHFML